ncbi:hypothetical protein KAI31_03610 [Candidatus Bathyarchaeota archaeon]|nr:hypothetical protein [Candidatus Bathyarchaeota archaeon]
MPITKIGVILLVVGLIGGGVAGYGAGFTIYQSRISQLESDISAKESQISQLQNSITSLQGQLNTLNSTLLSVQAQLAEAVANVTLLRTQLEEAQAELMPGRVPILHVGDWWIMEFVFNETTYTFTQNITGEGPDYYVMYEEYNPPYQGTSNMTYRVDKSTTYQILGQGQSEYTYDNTTIPYTYNVTYFYTYYGGVPFPMIVGKEFNMTEIMTYTMIMDNTTYTYEYNTSYVFEVETIESVTVPAGTFTCFKVNMWNATSGALLYTMWYSDEAKTSVKYIDYTTTPESTAELKDYSV